DRYVDTSMTAWEFARGKLRGDPVYRSVIFGGLLPSRGTLLDIGCGQGLTLALLAESARAFETGAWPAAWPSPPRFDRMIVIEKLRRVAAVAGTALGAKAEIIPSDAREPDSAGGAVEAAERPAAVLLFDVLHMMPAVDQERLVEAIAARLEPGGVML